jgi:hypothetical protein
MFAQKEMILLAGTRWNIETGHLKNKKNRLEAKPLGGF